MANTTAGSRRGSTLSNKSNGPLRRDSTGAEIAGIAHYDMKILFPGSIRINVKGAFIVDEDQVDGRLTPPDTRDIALPHHTDEVSHVAVDIGGSLAKVVYFTRDVNGKGGKLNFTKFETDRIEDCIEFMKSLLARSKENGKKVTSVLATGGGSVKYYELLQSKLGVTIAKKDEMESLIFGLDFFITKIPNEVFCYSEQNPMIFPQRPVIYPCLLVNIGSGVSMIKVLGPSKFMRIGGSSLGGGTLWGLLSLLTDANSFDDMLEMAAQGDNTNVDMLVGDVYGTDYSRIGLKATTIASSFGKVFREARKIQSEDIQEQQFDSVQQSRRNMFDGSDISRSLLYAISNNIGQIAYLQAQKHGLEHIYFGGSYIRGHPQTMHTLSYAVNFWSQGEKIAYFLRHEGYLGAVGAFLQQNDLVLT